jgi:hypothetical protein
MTEIQAPARFASERVIINAPMSFAGSAQRSWRLLGWLTDNTGGNVWLRRLVWAPFVVVPFVLAPWWAAVALWYVSFGLLLVPYRLLRRGARKRKAEALRHRELLDAIQQPKN